PDLHDPATGQSRVVYSQSFVPNSDTLDHYGHGTHVAGIIAGNGQASGGKSNPSRIYGVAPNVKLVNLKVLDANGSGQDSYVIAAIQRAIALKNVYGIRVINLSLGRPVFESFTQDPLCQAVEAAWNAGIVVVVAAGNQGRNNDYGTQGYGMIAAPGNDPSVITVGAMNTMSTPTKRDDVLASYSSKGPSMLDHVVKPDVVAPGNRVASLLVANSTLANSAPLNVVSPTAYGASMFAQPYYFRLSGTSMATPVVSGAAALLLDANPALTPDVIKARLMKTADKAFPVSSSLTINNVPSTYQYDIFSVGAGYINIPAALNNQDTLQGPALSPIVTRNSYGKIVLLNATTSVLGNSVVCGNSVVWGSSVVWGNSGCDGFSVVWGSSVVWGNGINGASSGNDALSIDDDGDPDGE